MSVGWLFLTAFALLISEGIFQNFQGAPTSGGCPERNGRFADPRQCDAYTECIDGVPSYKLCPDGLLFSEKALFTYPCLYPPEVDCGSRTGLQPAQSNELCPHLYGYYKLGDAAHCGQFINCANGIGYIFDCPEGLAFNELALRCDWPDQVASCNAEAYLGFTCPDIQNTIYDSSGYAFFRSPATCQKYFLCINGRPRLLSCSEDEAFNEITRSCDAPENVTGCAVPDSSRNKPTRFDDQDSFNSFQQQPPRNFG